MLFSLLKHYLDTDAALKVSQSVYCFTTFIPYGVENYFPRLWGTGISDAIFSVLKCEDIFWRAKTQNLEQKLMQEKHNFHSLEVDRSEMELSF